MAKRASPKSIDKRGLETKEALFKKYGLNGTFDRNTIVDFICRTGLKPSSRGRINTVVKYLVYQKHIKPTDNGRFTVWYRDKEEEAKAEVRKFPSEVVVSSTDAEESLTFAFTAINPNVRAKGRIILEEFTPEALNFLKELEQLMIKYNLGGT